VDNLTHTLIGLVAGKGVAISWTTPRQDIGLYLRVVPGPLVLEDGVASRFPVATRSRLS
jgi:hypothetical protein